MKKFQFDFVKAHEGFNGVVAYRFNFRLKDTPDRVNVLFPVCSPSVIQKSAEELVARDDVISAGCEFLYEIPLYHMSRITALKSEDEDLEVN